MSDHADRGLTRVPASRSKAAKRYASIAKVGSYVAPALATVLLFLAKSDPVWFWWAAAALIASIALQVGKDWWEKVLRERRSADLRELDLASAQLALGALGSTCEDEVSAAIYLGRRRILQALSREYEEWSGSRVTLVNVDESRMAKDWSMAVQVGDGPVAFATREADDERLRILSEVTKGGAEPLLSKVGKGIELANQATGSFIAVPVRMSYAHKLYGILLLQTSPSEALTQRDVEVVQSYADMLALTFTVQRASAR